MSLSFYSLPTLPLECLGLKINPFKFFMASHVLYPLDSRNTKKLKNKNADFL
jgi:hypothetical protein